MTMKLKRAALALIVLAALSVAGCGVSYEAYAGRYELISAGGGAAFSDFVYAEVTLTAGGKCSISCKTSGKNSALPASFEANGTFRLSGGEMTFSGLPLSSGLMRTKYFTADFTIGEVTVSGTFALVRTD